MSARYSPFFLLLLFLVFSPVLSGQTITSIGSLIKNDSLYIGNSVQDIPSPNRQITGSIEEYIQTNQTPHTEKIFLHLDRSSYIQGDTIWFKGYSWYGYEQVPDTSSSILYVDILNAEGKIKLSRKVLILNGTSEGDFTLDTTIIPGKYIIRAYTRWMQNGNTGQPFFSPFTVNPASQNFQLECNPVIVRHTEGDSLNIKLCFFEMDPSGKLKETYTHNIRYSLKIGEQLSDSGKLLASNTKEKFIRSSLTGFDKKEAKAVLTLSIDDKSLSFKKEFEIQLREGIDIQFFPEGGSMITGLKSKIAFKAIGYDGLSREVKGAIETKDGTVVTEFESQHKGMGYFLLTPDSGKEYFAHIIFNNLNYVIPLPVELSEGSVMNVSLPGNEDDPSIVIRCNPFKANTRKYITGSANGKIWFSALVRFSKDSCRLKIPLDLLPEGICRLTLLSDDFKPECERLIFVDKKERIKIEIKPDSSSYGPRSKVTLLVSAKDLNGTPVKTDLSVSVVDGDLSSPDPLKNNINVFKLLQSELSGYIEDPSFYFKDGNCADYKFLDLLLLTQGYRKFKTDKSITAKQKFEPETGFNVSGNIEIAGSKSRKEKFDYRKIDITFLSQSGKTYITQSNPDSSGRFNFQIPLLYGKPQAILQASGLKGKKINGKINIDEISRPPQFPIPVMTEPVVLKPVIESIRQNQTTIQTILAKDPTSGFMSKNLPDVVISAKAKNWYLDFDKGAKKIINLDSLDPKGNKFESLNELLLREFGAIEYIVPNSGIITIMMPCVSVFGPDNYFPIYLINGGVWFDGTASSFEEAVAKMKLVNSLHVNELKKLSVLPPTSDIVMHYANKDIFYEIKQTLIAIETYNIGYRGDPDGITSFIIDGLEAPRRFYSPVYNVPGATYPSFDGRTTLFWNPSVKTDSTGTAKINFFTSDRNTTFDVIVNGIEKDNGAPGNGQLQIKSIVNNSKSKILTK
jgi:hypothetical protein